MSFKRWLTSVLCSCILLSSILVVPASAADDDDYYSLPVVSDGSVSPASLGGIVLASTHTLDDIYNVIAPNFNPKFLNGKGTNALLYELWVQISNFKSRFPESYGSGVLSWLSTLHSDLSSVASQSTLSAISGKVATESTLHLLSANLSSKFDGGDAWYSLAQAFSMLFGYQKTDSGNFFYPVWGGTSSDDSSLFYQSWSSVVGNIVSTFSQFYNPNYPNGGHTVLWYLSMLQDVLANEDDKALRDSQKENVDQVKKDFVTGQSGKTSLGKNDFGSLSSVGGTFNDISSLNGQASLDSFSSGLSDADTAGQGWFSQSTKDALDSVSGSTTSESTVSTFFDYGLYSVDVDPDPYNMGNFEDNYSWLWGEK